MQARRGDANELWKQVGVVRRKLGLQSNYVKQLLEDVNKLKSLGDNSVEELAKIKLVLKGIQVDYERNEQGNIVDRYVMSSLITPDERKWLLNALDHQKALLNEMDLPSEKIEELTKELMGDPIMMQSQSGSTNSSGRETIWRSEDEDFSTEEKPSPIRIQPPKASDSPGKVLQPVFANGFKDAFLKLKRTEQEQKKNEQEANQA